MKLREAVPKRRAPGHTFVLPREAFADTYANKPEAPVAVGLQTLSERDMQAARGEAFRVAAKDATSDGRIIDQDEFIRAYNDALVRWAIATSMTDPNNVDIPYFEAAYDTVYAALTTEGALLVWDELIRLHASKGVGTRRATDAELVELGEKLVAGVGDLSAELRKLAWYLLKAIDDRST